MLLRDCSPRFSAGLRPREDLSCRLQAMNGVYEEIVLAYNHWEQELRNVVQASSAPPHLVLTPLPIGRGRYSLGSQTSAQAFENIEQTF